MGSKAMVSDIGHVDSVRRELEELEKISEKTINLVFGKTAIQPRNRIKIQKMLWNILRDYMTM